MSASYLFLKPFPSVLCAFRTISATQTTWTAGCITSRSVDPARLWTAPCRAGRASRATCPSLSGEGVVLTWGKRLFLTVGHQWTVFSVLDQGRWIKHQPGAHRSERPHLALRQNQGARGRYRRVVIVLFFSTRSAQILSYNTVSVCPQILTATRTAICLWRTTRAAPTPPRTPRTARMWRVPSHQRNAGKTWRPMVLRDLSHMVKIWFRMKSGFIITINLSVFPKTPTENV